MLDVSILDKLTLNDSSETLYREHPCRPSGLNGISQLVLSPRGELCSVVADAIFVVILIVIFVVSAAAAVASTA